MPFCHRSGGPALEMNLVTVYDIQNKFVAYSAPVAEVVDVLCEWGSLYVLAGDGKVCHALLSHITKTVIDLTLIMFVKGSSLLASVAR